MKGVELVTYGPNKLFDVTRWVEEECRGVKEGAVLVFAKGSTGALVLLEEGEVEGFERDLWGLVEVYGWEHPGNAYAHLRSTLMGTGLVLPVVDGRPVLGGRRVYFVENQPALNRHRKLYVHAIPIGIRRGSGIRRPDPRLSP